MVPVIVVGFAAPAFFKVKSKCSFEKFATETPELISSILVPGTGFQLPLVLPICNKLPRLLH